MAQGVLPVKYETGNQHGNQFYLTH